MRRPRRAAARRRGSVALGHTECEVARAAGAPDNVSDLERMRAAIASTVLTYVARPARRHLPFTAGRLSSIERGAEPEPPRAQAEAASDEAPSCATA